MYFIKITLALFFGILLFCFATQPDKKQKKNAIKALNENYSFISSGKLIVEKDTLSIQSFIMFKTEVSNFEYTLFLNDLKKNGDLTKYKIAQIDSSLWSDNNSMNAKYQQYYHTHSAYRDYPVLNISKQGAELYCEWASEKINTVLGSDKKIIFRLPTHAEWMFAAHGGIELNNYPWAGQYLRNSNGNYLCNFLSLDATSISRNNDGEYRVVTTNYNLEGKSDFDVTSPVKSYWPNGYGLYNMSGNVAEMVSDKEIVVGGSWTDPGYDVRIESEKQYTGPSRTTGFRMVATVIPSENSWLKVKKK